MSTPAAIAPAREHDAWTLLFAIVCVSAASDVIVLVSPFLLGAMVERFQASVGLVSFVFMGQVVATALATAGVSAWLPRLRLRHVAIAGLAVKLASDAVSALTGSLALLALSRTTAGAAEGCCLAAALAIGARTRNPDRTYAVVLFGVLVVFLGVLGLIPALGARYGPAGTFWAMAAVAAFALPWVRWLEEIPGGGEAAPAGADMPMTGDGARMLAAQFLLFFAFGVLWLYVERIGTELGLSLERVTQITSLSLVLGLASPAAAYGATARWGRSLPLGVAIACQLVGGLLLTHGESVGLYVVANMALTTVLLFLIPALRGVTAQMDASGRLAAAAGAAVCVSGIFAPLAGGGLLLLGAGYAGIGWFATLAFALALTLVWPVLRRLDGERIPRTVSPSFRAS